MTLPRNSGAPNDDFLPNALKTVFQTIQGTFRPLQMHSKYYICSVIPGELKSFRNSKGFGIIFPKMLDAIWRITKVKRILIPLSITFLNPKILRFLIPGRKIALPEV